MLFGDLPRPHLMPLGVIEEQVDIAGYMAEYSQQQRDLTTVMNTMIGPVLHQLAQCH